MELASGPKIETNTVEVFSDWSNGEMWTGSGDRRKSSHVSFPNAFDAKPTVTVAIALLDAGNQDNTRVHTWPDNVTTTGFDIVVRTWEHTKLATVAVSWLAIGQ